MLIKNKTLFPGAGNGLLFIILLGFLSFGMRHLDSSRIVDKRVAYERFIRESALPFRNLGHRKSGNGQETDSPELASLQEFFMTVDPVSQRVPAERLLDAYNSLNENKSNRLKSATSYQVQWTGTSADMGGRTRAILWDPLVPNKVWAGGVTGGLWYNNDITAASSSWQPVNDMWDNLAISSITYDPENPLVMYVGTGEAQTALITYRESSGRGVGIWKTTDGGQTWALLPSTSQFAYVTKMVVRSDGINSVIYAGVASGYYHGNQQSQPSDGLYRSANGGLTWQQVLPNITGYTVPYCVSDITLGADGRIYVGTMQNIAGNGGAVLLYSNTGLSGSWTRFEAVATLIQSAPKYKLANRVVIATALSDANIVYAAFSAGYIETGDRPYYFGEYLYRSDNKGVTWYQVNLPGNSHEWANLAWHAMILCVDPSNPDIIYAGGLDQWRSIDGGLTWNHLSDWSLMYFGGGDQYIHADQHAIAYQPGSSSTVIFSTDGGIFLSENANAGIPVFQQRNKNYNTLQFYTGVLQPTAGTTGMVGGLQDNGTLLYQGVPLSIDNMISGGDGAFCFWDKDNPIVIITSIYFNRYYIFENTTNTNFIDRYSGVFVNPADYSSTYNTLYANACDFWGAGADQLLRASNIPSNIHDTIIAANTNATSYFSHVKISPFSTNSSHNLFLGTVSGRLFKVTDANTVPFSTEIGSPMFPTANISCVAIGGSEDTLLVTFSNYGVSSIWQTYNGGQTWKEVEGNLPDMPVRWAIYHPQNSKQALIATELGVWSTGNLQAAQVNWIPQTTGMANVRVDMLTLRISDNTVLAASHGRGLFTAKFNLDVTTPTKDFAGVKDPFTVTVSSSAIEIQSDIQQTAEYSLYTASGNLQVWGRLTAGTRQNFINTTTLSKGVYLFSIEYGEQRFVKKVFLY